MYALRLVEQCCAAKTIISQNSYYIYKQHTAHKYLKLYLRISVSLGLGQSIEAPAIPWAVETFDRLEYEICFYGNCGVCKYKWNDFAGAIIYSVLRPCRTIIILSSLIAQLTKKECKVSLLFIHNLSGLSFLMHWIWKTGKQRELGTVYASTISIQFRFQNHKELSAHNYSTYFHTFETAYYSCFFLHNM